MLHGWLIMTFVLLAPCQLVCLISCQSSKEEKPNGASYTTNIANEYAIIGGSDIDKAVATSQSKSQGEQPSDSESESSNGEPNASQSESSSGEPHASQSESSSGGFNGSEPQPPAPTARQKRRFNCSHANRSSSSSASDADTTGSATTTTVVLLNSTDFAELKAAVSPGGDQGNSSTSSNQSACAVLLYYLPYCPYSVALAPHYNALARAFPGLHFFAANANHVSPFYANYTASLAPYIRLFRDRDFLGVNTSLRSLDLLVAELANLTGHSPVPNVTLTAADLVGPVSSSLAHPTDYWLLLSCLYFCLLLPYLASGSARVRAWWTRLRLGLGLGWRPHAD